MRAWNSPGKNILDKRALASGIVAAQCDPVRLHATEAHSLLEYCPQ